MRGQRDKFRFSPVNFFFFGNVAKIINGADNLSFKKYRGNNHRNRKTSVILSNIRVCSSSSSSDASSQGKIHRQFLFSDNFPSFVNNRNNIAQIFAFYLVKSPANHLFSFFAHGNNASILVNRNHTIAYADQHGFLLSVFFRKFSYNFLNPSKISEDDKK